MAPCYGWRSPHTRGARVQHQPVKAQPRIIPAYAGSTDRPLGRPRPGADHPRIRGEHHAKAFEAWNVQGSSPHTRGAPPQRHHRRPESRIIPAYAGSTCPEDAYECFLEGSSPHTRGAPTDSRSPSGAGRIIPAYAGSTDGLPIAEWRRADHPRIRGEHSGLPLAEWRRAGSSPHTRGARHARRRRRRRRRIIPAYAGSTCRRRRDDSYCRDDPRIRGEHAPCLGPTGRRTGIIPAYAGSTGWPKHHIKPHPGSSPHTRGARR